MIQVVSRGLLSIYFERASRGANAWQRMRIYILFIAILWAFTSLGSGAQDELRDQRDKLSYSIGNEIGNTLRKRSFDLNQEGLKTGVRDGLSGGQPRLTEIEMKGLMTKIENEKAAKLVADRKVAGEKNAIEGPKFLAENKKKKGVKTTESGLQYMILREGSGPTPNETDRVVINFIGMTVDGNEFESSYKSGHAETVLVSRMIKGWREGLQLMKVGSKCRLYLPPELAFGKIGAGPIAPNASLVFDIELLGIPAAPKITAHASPSAGAARP